MKTKPNSDRKFRDLGKILFDSKRHRPKCYYYISIFSTINLSNYYHRIGSIICQIVSP